MTTIILQGSPNSDSNRKKIDLVVIHWFGTGTLKSADARFQNPNSAVSAHYGISGNTIFQWVKEERVAYHAGNYEVNQRSIGIEHDATQDHPATEETYKTSAALISRICERYNIPLDSDHIVPHYKFKATKWPGSIDINKLISLAKPVIIEEMKFTDQTLIPIG